MVNFFIRKGGCGLFRHMFFSFSPSAMSKPKNWPPFHLSLFLISVFIIFSAGCVRTAVPVTEETLTVPASVGSIRKSAAFVGNVTSGQSAALSWKTSGVIGNVYVSIGDEVSEGQILAALEKDSLSAQVLNAEIPFINALDELEEILSSETPKAQAYMDLKDKEAALVTAEKYQESLKYPHAVSSEISYWAEQTEIYRQAYEDALSSLNDAASWRKSPDESDRNLYEARRKTMLTALNKYAEVYNTYLYYSGTATDNENAQAAADIDTAQADYEKALRNFRTYSSYPREKDIASAQLKIDNAQNTYNQRNIIASINGTVTEISAREGDYVTRNSAAFRLDNKQHLYIPLDISEIDIPNIYAGMKAQIVLDANTRKTYSGIVSSVSSSGTASGSRVTFETLVEILEPDENVRIGMTAEVSLVLSESENVLLVPSNAVFQDNGVSYVTVFNGSSSYDVPVTAGITTDTVTEITGGYLKEGDPVLVPSVDSSILRDMGLDSPAAEGPGTEGRNEG